MPRGGGIPCGRPIIGGGGLTRGCCMGTGGFIIGGTGGCCDD